MQSVNLQTGQFQTSLSAI